MKIIKKEKRQNGRRRIYLLGVKILSYKKKSPPSSNLFPDLWQIQRVRSLHSAVFPQFKNIHQGKDVVVLATGPSVRNFIPIKDAVYIGINKAFQIENVTLDYLFMQDYTGLKNYIEDSFPYKNEKLVRFYGIEPPDMYETIPESIALRHHAHRYYVYIGRPGIPPLPSFFAYDLSSEELYGERSVVFSALQFALWTNPKRIYLVGCDCTNTGYFQGNETSSSEGLEPHYRQLKKFIDIYYPETEIISVNPVGLKGIFKDLYQGEQK